jgi:hypothetical protein
MMKLFGKHLNRLAKKYIYRKPLVYQVVFLFYTVFKNKDKNTAIESCTLHGCVGERKNIKNNKKFQLESLCIHYIN